MDAPYPTARQDSISALVSEARAALAESPIGGRDEMRIRRAIDALAAMSGRCR